MSRAPGFLDRWSRRKSAARREADREPAGPAPDTDAPPPDAPGRVAGTGDAVRADAEGRPGAGAVEAPPDTPAPDLPESDLPEPDLPEPETLDAGSDFAAFMRSEVPEALRRRALRRLWQVDPVFSRMDGLVEYGEDYAAIGRSGKPVATAFAPAWRQAKAAVAADREGDDPNPARSRADGPEEAPPAPVADDADPMSQESVEDAGAVAADACGTADNANADERGDERGTAAGTECGGGRKDRSSA